MSIKRNTEIDTHLKTVFSTTVCRKDTSVIMMKPETIEDTINSKLQLYYSFKQYRCVKIRIQVDT